MRTLMIALVLTMGLTQTAEAKKNPVVELNTTEGKIVVELNPAKAPISVKNFLSYVRSGHYSGTIFHRVIASFMIQGGGFTEKLSKKPTKPPIKLEAGNGLSNLRGTIAMARTGVRDSATAQFFINVVDNKRLDSAGGGYAVFGKVIKGMDVVDRIRRIPTRPNPQAGANLPTKTVVIKSAKAR